MHDYTRAPREGNWVQADTVGSGAAMIHFIERTFFRSHPLATDIRQCALIYSEQKV